MHLYFRSLRSSDPPVGRGLVVARQRRRGLWKQRRSTVSRKWRAVLKLLRMLTDLRRRVAKEVGVDVLRGGCGGPDARRVRVDGSGFNGRVVRRAGPLGEGRWSRRRWVAQARVADTTGFDLLRIQIMEKFTHDCSSVTPVDYTCEDCQFPASTSRVLIQKINFLPSSNNDIRGKKSVYLKEPHVIIP